MHAHAWYCTCTYKYGSLSLSLSLSPSLQWGYDAYLNTLLHQSVDYWKTQQNVSDLTSSGSISHPVTPPNGGRGSSLSSEREDIEREVKLLERKAMAYLEENER